MFELIDKINGLWNSVSDQLHYWFNPIFWEQVEYTAIAIIGAGALSYFFPQLRAFCGAVFLSTVALWYGYHKGQQSREDQ